MNAKTRVHPAKRYFRFTSHHTDNNTTLEAVPSLIREVDSLSLCLSDYYGHVQPCNRRDKACLVSTQDATTHPKSRFGWSFFCSFREVQGTRLTNPIRQADVLLMVNALLRMNHFRLFGHENGVRTVRGRAGKRRGQRVIANAK